MLEPGNKPGVGLTDGHLSRWHTVQKELKGPSIRQASYTAAALAWELSGSSQAFLLNLNFTDINELRVISNFSKCL